MGLWRAAAALAVVLAGIGGEPIGWLPSAWAQGQANTEAQRFHTQTDGVERSTDLDAQGRPRSAFTLPPVTSAHCLPGRHWELAGGVAGCVCDGDATHTRVSNDQPAACQGLASPLPSITVARGGTVFGLGDGGYLSWSTRDATALSMSCKDGAGTVYFSLGGLSGGLSWSYDVAGAHSCTWVAIGPGGSKTLVEGFSVGAGTPVCTAQAARCEGSALVQRDSCGQALATWANHASCAPPVTCTHTSYTQSELCASPLSGTLTRLYSRTTCTDGSVTDTLTSQSGACTTVSAPTKTCSDGSVIAQTDTCPALTRTCPDGTVRPVTVPCPDSPPGTQTCWDGSVIALTATCPDRPPGTQTCWDGSVIALTATCPDRPPGTQTCWDGSVIALTAACPDRPPGTQTCWDGSVIALTATCPDRPPGTQTCWDGSVIALTATCPDRPPLCTAQSALCEGLDLVQRDSCGAVVATTPSAALCAPTCTDTQWTDTTSQTCPPGTSGTVTLTWARHACSDGRQTDLVVGVVSSCRADQNNQPTFTCVGNDWTQRNSEGATVVIEANSVTHGCVTAQPISTLYRVSTTIVDWDGSGYPRNWDICVTEGGASLEALFNAVLDADSDFQAMHQIINTSVSMVTSGAGVCR